MREIASSHVSAISHDIQHNISSTMEGLEYMLEKTAVPRPQALGKQETCL